MKTLTANSAKKLLKLKGWSYRKAAPELNVNWSHLAKVLTGQRHSKALLQRIAELREATNDRPAA